MLYEAQCSKCHTMHEYFSSVADREITPVCCGKHTVKGIFSAPMVGAMSWGREKAVTMPDGTFIETGSEYKRYMKNNKKISADEGHAEAERARKRKKAEFKKQLHNTVVDTYDKLKAGKKAA